MANDIVQTIAEARVDARSLSEFVFKPAGFKVARRLAPPVDTLQFYIDRFNSLNGDFSSSVSVALSSLNSSVAEADGKVAYIETTVQDAINNTAIEGGVLADTFVVVDATLNQRQINRGFESIADMLSIANPNNGLRVYVKSYFPNLAMGGGWFVYDSSKSDVNDEGIIINGWVRVVDGESVHPAWFGVRTDGTDDLNNPNHELLQKAVDAGYKSFYFGGNNFHYLFNGQVGLKRQGFYSTGAYYVTGDGAKIQVEGTLAWLTTEEVKAAGGESSPVSGAHTGKLFIYGLTFTGQCRDGVFDGDFLYNIFFSKNDCYKLKVLSRSYRPKSVFANGYFQSVYIDSCHFASCTDVLTGSRGYNIVASNNMFEGCTTGFTIFGEDQPSLNNFRLVNNVFEGGGQFAKIGDTLGGVISGNYFEGNIAGRIASEKCHVHVIRSGAASFFNNIYFGGNTSQERDFQIADPDFQMIKWTGFNTSFAAVSLINNWSSSRVTNAPIPHGQANQSGASASDYNNPRSAQASYVDTNYQSIILPLATKKNGEFLDLVTFTLPDNSNDTVKDTVLDLTLKCVGLTAGGVDLVRFTVNIRVFIFALLTRGDGGRRPQDLGVVIGKAEIIQQPATTIVDTSLNVGHPKLFSDIAEASLVSAGNTHTIRLSGMTVPSFPNYGSISSIEVAITSTGYNNIYRPASRMVKFTS